MELFITKFLDCAAMAPSLPALFLKKVQLSIVKELIEYIALPVAALFSTNLELIMLPPFSCLKMAPPLEMVPSLPITLLFSK